MSELEEVDRFIASSSFEGVKNCLQSYRQTLIATNKATEKNSLNTSTSTSTNSNSMNNNNQRPATVSVGNIGGGISYIPITDYAWDQDGYNTPTIKVYIDLPEVGKVKDNVNTQFGQYSIDMTITGLNGKNYRLLQTNLEKDIVPSECKTIVKKDSIIIKLQKVKGEYSYENWNSLIAKTTRDPTKEAEKKANPMGGIMDMMKEMYDSGDDNMKKVIGEAMLKSREGKGGKDDMSGMPGMPPLGDM